VYFLRIGTVEYRVQVLGDSVGLSPPSVKQGFNLQCFGMVEECRNILLDTLVVIMIILVKYHLTVHLPNSNTVQQFTERARWSILGKGEVVHYS
jgi:hypothetical protein